MRNLRYALRTLLRNPGYASVAVLTLALGIGANAAIFSVVNGVLLRPLPFGDPDRIVGVWTSFTSRGVDRDIFSPPNFLDLAERSRSFDAVAAYRYWGYDITGAGEPERVTAALVSPAFFRVMGVAPALGRSLTPGEDVPGHDGVVVIGHGLWQRRFGGDPGVVGRSIILSGRTYLVAGVMPSGFQFPERAQVWAPIAFTDAQRQQRGAIGIDVAARLKDDITFDQAQAEMRALGTALASDFPQQNAGMGITLLSLHEQIVGGVRLSLLVLIGAVAFVLLIACANLANLLLASASIRHREFAIRAALGASRGRLVVQLLAESLVLAILGGTLGLLLAWWSVDLLVAISPGDIPRLGEVGLDVRVFGFTLVISLLTGLLFGLIPAVTSLRTDLHGSLKEGGRGGGAGVGRNRLRGALVSLEVALVLVLLVGAGLMIRSFSRLHAERPGFQPDRLLALQLFLPQSRYGDEAARRAFHDAVLTNLDSLDGARSAALASPAPFSTVPIVIDTLFRIAGHPDPPAGEEPVALFNRVSPGYFRTLGTPVLRGREFTPQDDEKSPQVAIISDTMARRFWPGEDPIGRKLVLGHRQPITLEIVGVAGDMKRLTLEAGYRPEIYVPFAQRPTGQIAILVRAKGDAADLGPAVKTRLWAVDKDLPATYLSTMDHLITASLARPRFNTALLAAFAGLALLLAMVGLYGVIAYTVSQRTQEIGVRMALGAQRADILRLVLSHGVVLTAAGVAAGLAVALAMARSISGLLYGVSVFDPMTYACVTLLTAAVAMLACYIPARRATKVDPMIALRYE